MQSLKDKNSELISKRWAKALIELTGEDTSVSRESSLKDLRLVADTINSSEELSDVISNPSISTEEKQIVICKLFQDKVSSIVYNFIFALNLRKRLCLIEDIANEFEKELDVLNNIKHVNVTSAIELSENKKDEIKSKIEAKLNAGLDVDWDSDEDIIAGLVFNIDEVLIDNSVKHKLADLSESIIR